MKASASRWISHTVATSRIPFAEFSERTRGAALSTVYIRSRKRSAWCAETAREQQNAGAMRALLVVKRAGHGAAKVGGWHVVQNDGGMLVKFRLDEYMSFLMKLGFDKDGVDVS